ncbi:hypothetical protein Hanom_Chr10g00936181 [Helianthus anomalus]
MSTIELSMTMVLLLKQKNTDEYGKKKKAKRCRHKKIHIKFLHFTILLRKNNC